MKELQSSCQLHLSCDCLSISTLCVVYTRAMLYLLVGRVSDQTQIWWFKSCISCERLRTQHLQCHKTNSQRPPSQRAAWRQRRAKSLGWSSWGEVCFIFLLCFYTCWFTGWALPQKQQAQEPFFNWVSWCLAVIMSIRPQGKCPDLLWIQRDYMDRLDLFIITKRTREVSSRRSEASSVNQCFCQSWTSTVTSTTERQELDMKQKVICIKLLTWCLYET